MSDSSAGCFVAVVINCITRAVCRLCCCCCSCCCLAWSNLLIEVILIFLFSLLCVCVCLWNPAKCATYFYLCFRLLTVLPATHFSLSLPLSLSSLSVCHTCCRWRCHNTLIRVIYNTFVLASVRLADAAAPAAADAGSSQVAAAARQLYCILSRGRRG